MHDAFYFFLMNSIVIQASVRDEKIKHAKELRRQNLIPCVVYGGGIDNKHIAVQTGSFLKTARDIGESTLVDLVIDGLEPLKVLIADVQRDAVSGEILHIDFRNVRMDQEIEAEIELRFVDESPGVKELGAILVKSVESMKVKCLPSALVDSIEVSLSSLKNYGDRISLKDIAIPAGMRVLDDMNSVIVLLAEPVEEKEAVAPAAEMPEVLTEKKEDAEGAAAEGGEKKKEEKK